MEDVDYLGVGHKVGRPRRAAVRMSPCEPALNGRYSRRAPRAGPGSRTRPHSARPSMHWLLPEPPVDERTKATMRRVVTRRLSPDPPTQGPRPTRRGRGAAGAPSVSLQLVAGSGAIAVAQRLQESADGLLLVGGQAEVPHRGRVDVDPVSY